MLAAYLTFSIAKRSVIQLEKAQLLHGKSCIGAGQFLFEEVQVKQNSLQACCQLLVKTKCSLSRLTQSLERSYSVS